MIKKLIIVGMTALLLFSLSACNDCCHSGSSDSSGQQVEEEVLPDCCESNDTSDTEVQSKNEPQVTDCCGG